MSNEDLFQFINPAFWIKKHGIKSENGRPLSFKTHPFMLEPYTDWSQEVVTKKSSQIGYSTMAILRTLHFCAMRDSNVIYTLPNRSIGSEFLTPKFDPLMEHNPMLRQMMTGTNTPSLKQIGQKYAYFRGSWTETEAISISADVLIQDESDRSDQKVLNTYRKRLDAADADKRIHWTFSNPSTPGFGVDELYQSSTKHQWMVKCKNKHEQVLTFPESIDFERACYQCSVCHVEITDDQRHDGQWIAEAPGASRKGYWITQLMAPWIPASKILKDYAEDDPDVFWNYTIGEAYAPSDMLFTREAIMRKLVPGTELKGEAILAVDNGVKKHWVLGTPQGIFKYGVTEDWDEIERIKSIMNATIIMDAMPYPAKPQMFVEKYPGEAWMHYYVQDKKNEGSIKWQKKESVVHVDRTRTIDRWAIKLAGETPEEPFVFHMTGADIEPFISHFLPLRRVTEVNTFGIERGIWQTPEGKDDHWAHASFMFWVMVDGLATEEGIGHQSAEEEPIDPLLYDPETSLNRKPNPFKQR